MEKANNTHWKSLPNEHILLQYNEEYTEKEYFKISNGHIPKGMEDKWYIFLDCNNILHIHRSWTGYCMYQLTIEKTEDKYIAKEVKVNRNKDQYNQNDDEYDIQLLHFLISNLLLEKSISFPIPKYMKKEKHKGLFQHHLSGTAYPESNNLYKK